MKMEKFILGLFASLLMVGCSQNDDLSNGGEEAKGKDSYVSVNIISRTGASRAPVFEYGSDVENQVNSAYFFFFKTDDSPYMLVEGTADYRVENSETPVSGSATNNWLYFEQFNVNSTSNKEDPAKSVEEILSAVLCFDGVESELPDKMVVVLNGPETLIQGQNGVSLNELANILVDETNAFSTENGGNFMMSNSVYQGNGQILQATSIAGKAMETAELAFGNPVDVYVERLAAKVSVESLNQTDLIEGQELNTASDALKINGVQVNGNNVYAKILGWDLNTTVNKSYLLKHLTANASYNGFDETNPWNDATNHRSYWAETPYGDVEYDKKFAWHSITNGLGSSTVDYCLENTTNTTTKIVVAAELVNDSGDAITVAQWMAKYYVPTAEGDADPSWEGPNSLFDDVANSLGLFYSDNGTWVKIKPDQLQIVPLYGTIEDPSENANDYYKVKFALNSNITNPLTWRAAESAEAAAEAEDLVDDDVNAIIGNVAPAKVWQKGATYYFTALKHVNGEDAVVRNHHYVVSISGVNGLGTPVYYPDSYTPQNPTIPEILEPVVPDDEIYLSAKIKVLSWKLVSNDVVLGQ